LAYDDTTDVFDLLQRWQNEFDKVTEFISTGRSTVSFPIALCIFCGAFAIIQTVYHLNQRQNQPDHQKLHQLLV